MMAVEDGINGQTRIKIHGQTSSLKCAINGFLRDYPKTCYKSTLKEILKRL